MMTPKRYREKAKELFGEAGVVELDLEAEVSMPATHKPEDDPKGAYVQAWVWVPDDEKEEEKTESQK